MKRLSILLVILLAGCGGIPLLQEAPDFSTQEGRNAHWAAQRAISEADSAAWERNCSENSEIKPECQPIDLTANWQ